jgi:hypothetical protein
MKITYIILIFICLTSVASAADPTDVGKDMVKGGIETAIVDSANSIMYNFAGVTTGNVSNVNETASQRLIEMVALYQQHPYKVGWVRKEVVEDYLVYVLAGIIIIIFTAIFLFAQVIWPEQVGAATAQVYGYEKFFDFRMFIGTLAKLIAIPMFLPFALSYAVDLEQVISSGIMQDSLQYISLSTSNIPLYVVQALSYMCCGNFVVARILIINDICAKVFFVALLLCIPWDFSKAVGEMILLYFVTLLAMRPMMLWITAMSIKYVADADPLTQNVLGTWIYVCGVLVVFCVCVLATLWPPIYVTIKVLSSRAVRNAMRIARMF